MDEYNKTIKSIISFKKKNDLVLKEWNALIDKAKYEIFKKYCIKDHTEFDECSVGYCLYYNNKKCKYPEEYQKLKNIIENFKTSWQNSQ